MSLTLSERDLAPIIQVIQQRMGIRIRPDQLVSLSVIVESVMHRSGIETPEGFLKALRHDSSAYQMLVEELTVGETYFFREPRHFDFISQSIIPTFRAAKGKSACLRAWSAACASGEEAYSLAMVFDQSSQPVHVVASDLSAAALQKARQAKYRPWSFRGEARKRASPYVIQHGEVFQLEDSIRKNVRFQFLNLATASYPNAETGLCNFDLILCRNVLIYFARETVDEIAQRLIQCLRPGGWLITASGDPSLIGAVGFEAQANEFGTFYRRPAEPAIFPEMNRVIQRQEKRPDESEAMRPSKPTATTITSGIRSPGKTSGSNSQRQPVHHRHTINPQDSNSAPSNPHWLRSARVALESGDYQLAIRLTDQMMHQVEASVINLRARDHVDPDSAREVCLSATTRHPLSHELHFLYGRMLMQRGEIEKAFKAIQKSLFLDRSSVISHFLFGVIQRQRGEWESARRHFRNTIELCDRLPAQSIVPMSDRETASEIANAAQSELTRLPELT